VDELEGVVERLGRRRHREPERAREPEGQRQREMDEPDLDVAGQAGVGDGAALDLQGPLVSTALPLGSLRQAL
jgi:hypothetical protein